MNKQSFKVVIKNKKTKKAVKTYQLPFTNSFEAFEWGERQAKEFGSGHFVELGKR